MEVTEQKTAGETSKPKYSVTVTTLKKVNDASNDDLSTVTAGSKRKFQDIDDFIEEELFRLEKKKKDQLQSLPVFTGQINAASPDTSIIYINNPNNICNNNILSIKAEWDLIVLQLKYSFNSTLLNDQNTTLCIPSIIIKSEEIIEVHDSTDVSDSPLNRLRSNSSLIPEIGAKVVDSVSRPPLQSNFNDAIVIEIDSTKSKFLQADNHNTLNQSTISLAEYSEEIPSASLCLLQNGSQTEDISYARLTDVNETIVSKSKKDEILDDNKKEASCAESIVSVSSDKRPSVKKLSQNVKRNFRLVKQKSPVKKSAAANQLTSTSKQVPRVSKGSKIRKFKHNRWKHDSEKLPVTVEPPPAPVEQLPPTIVTIRPPIRVMVKSLDPLEYVVCTEDGLPPQFTPVLSQLDSKSKKCDSTQHETKTQHEINSTQHETNSTQYETQHEINSTQHETNSTQHETNSTQYETNSTPTESECIVPPSDVVPSYLLVAKKNPWDVIPLQNLNENENISNEEKLVKYFSENKLSARSIVEDHIQWLRDSKRLWYTCPHCKYRSFSKLQFNHHVRHAHQYEPVECEVCDENFKSLRLLERHTKMKHPGNIVCKLCHQNFQTYQALLSHCVKHPYITNFDCYFCDEFKIPTSTTCTLRNMTFRSHLLTHIKNDLDAKKREFRLDIPALECEICAVRFESEAHYNLHKKVAHKNMTDQEKEKIKESRAEKCPKKQMKLAQEKWKMDFRKRQREERENRKAAKKKRVEERERITEEERRKRNARLKRKYKYRNMTYADIQKRLLKMISEEEKNEGLQVDTNQQSMENTKNDRKKEKMNSAKACNKDETQEKNSKMRGKKFEDQAKKRKRQKNQKGKDGKQDIKEDDEEQPEKEYYEKQKEKVDDEKEVDYEKQAEKVEDKNLSENVQDVNLTEQVEDVNLADKVEDENLTENMKDGNLTKKGKRRKSSKAVKPYENENLAEDLIDRRHEEQQITN